MVLRQNGAASIAQSDTQSKLFEYTLSYNKELAAKHNFNAVAGYTFQQTDWEGFNAGNQNFIADISQYYALQSGQSDKPTVDRVKARSHGHLISQGRFILTMETSLASLCKKRRFIKLC